MSYLTGDNVTTGVNHFKPVHMVNAFCAGIDGVFDGVFNAVFG